MPPSPTTMDSLKEDNVEDILLRLPSWASLEHAMITSNRFWHIASDPDFLRRFRARHASSSPPSFLAVFAQRRPLGLTVFHLAGQAAQSDPSLVAVARTCDFLRASLEDDPAWRILDYRNGRLLLSKGTSTLTIYDPISLRRTDISPPRDDPFPNGYISGTNCLIDDGDGSFRIISLQVDGRHRVRAVEYDSRVDQWRFHLLAADAAITPPPTNKTMYAAGLLFWNHDGPTGTSSLMLDICTMDFSMLCLPTAARGWMVYRYSIGETEDGECCLMCVTVDRLLQVWLLRKNRADDGGRQWEFYKEKPLIVLLAGHYCERPYVRKVVAGLVIIWGCNRGASNQYHHYAIDLKNFRLKAIFSDVDPARVIGAVYPFQLPWPPAGLTPAKRHLLQIDR